MSMYHVRTALLLTLTCSALALTGCTAETKSCKSVSGNYEALYTPLAGNCGPVPNPNRVPFEGGRSGVNTTIQTFATARVVTDIVMSGCTARMTQTVQENGSIKSRIDGTPIDIENENQLTGTVEMMRWDDNGQLACTGSYDAVFTKHTVTIGAAAQ